MKGWILAVAMGLWGCSVAWAEEARPEGRGDRARLKAAAARDEKGNEGDAADAEATRRVKELLKTKKVSFDFVATPADDVMAFLRNLLNVNIVVAPEVDQKKPLTLRVNEMMVGSALQWLVKLLGGRMEVKDGAIYISADLGEAARDRMQRMEAFRDRFRRRRTLGKAVLNIGGAGTVEIELSEEDLEPETRAMLLKLLHAAIAREVEKLEKEEGQGRGQRGREEPREGRR